MIRPLEAHEVEAARSAARVRWVDEVLRSRLSPAEQRVLTSPEVLDEWWPLGEGESRVA